MTRHPSIIVGFSLHWVRQPRSWAWHLFRRSGSTASVTVLRLWLARSAPAGEKGIQEMLGHSSITITIMITSDTYTSLLPEADLAIAEAAARIVPRARATTGHTAPEGEADPGGAESGSAEPVPDGADRLGKSGRSTSRPLTQTAPDEKSEAGQSFS
ncbi:hypothetical protein ACIA8M_30355 [Streptomyces anulatus]